METETSHADNTTASRTCHYGLWLSSSEKASLKRIAEKEKFVSISQFIRHRCLNETLTNSELVNELMMRIAQKIELECAKIYPLPIDKEYKKEMLRSPRILKTSSSEKLRKHEQGFLTNITSSNLIERSYYVGLTLTKEEKACLKENAQLRGFNTVAKYVRDRCLREQISKNDIIKMFMSFMNMKFMEGLLSPDRKLEWKKQSVKKRVNMSFITLGMDEKKKKKFETEFQKLTETYSNEIQEELTAILLAQKQKIDNGAHC